MKVWLPQDAVRRQMEDQRILRVCKHAWPVLEEVQDLYGVSRIAPVIFIKDIVCQMISQRRKE